MKTLKTHPLNVTYLVVGLIFLGIAGFWALRTIGVVDSADGRWLGPLLLVGAGVVGLVGFASKNLGRDRDHEEHRDELTGPEPAFDPYPTYDAGYEPTRDLTPDLHTPTQDHEGERR
jgi:hypothetical protein